MKIKTYIMLMFLAIFGINGTISAQQADERIGNILNSADWFTLREEFPALKSKMQSEMLKRMSEAMIGYHFNQPQKAIDAIGWLLENAQHEMGFGNTSNFVLIKSTILAGQGRYAEGADMLSAFLTQVAQFADLNDFPVHNQTFAHYESLRNETKPAVIRPDRDIEIPLIFKDVIINDVNRGQLMYIPIQVNGEEYNFIFDTGANTTFLSQHFANEMGVRIVKDSLVITGGFQTDIGKKGVLDSFLIGDIIFKNPVTVISLPNEEVDTIFQVDAILGIDFMKMMGEVQIFPQENRVVFPLQKTAQPSFGSNLMLLNGVSPFLKTYSNGERLLFHFDTGAVTTDLLHTFYAKHQEKLSRTGERRTAGRGGFGGTVLFDAYQLPELSLTVGDTDVLLTDIDVLVDETEHGFSGRNNEHGVLGMDFITSFRKITINFIDMFVKVEK